MVSARRVGSAAALVCALTLTACDDAEPTAPGPPEAPVPTHTTPNEPEPVTAGSSTSDPQPAA